MLRKLNYPWPQAIPIGVNRMYKYNVLTLIGVTNSQDAIRQQVQTVTRREVYCNISSVSASEWFEAGRSGLKPEYRVTMFSPDYKGEELAELDEKPYGIYRTYEKNPYEIELYLERKAGVSGGNQN